MVIVDRSIRWLRLAVVHWARFELLLLSNPNPRAFALIRG